MKEYRSLAFDEPGEQLLFLATNDTSKVEQKRFAVRYYRSGADSAIVLADHEAAGLPEGWIFSENASPSFSKNGERVLVGAAPRREPKDTTIVDFEMARSIYGTGKIRWYNLSSWWNKAGGAPHLRGHHYPNQPQRFVTVATERCLSRLLPMKETGGSRSCGRTCLTA